MQMAIGFHNRCTFLGLHTAEGVNARGGFATPKEVYFMQMALGFHNGCTFLDLRAAESVNARGGFATRWIPSNPIFNSTSSFHHTNTLSRNRLEQRVRLPVRELRHQLSFQPSDR